MNNEYSQENNFEQPEQEHFAEAASNQSDEDLQNFIGNN